MKIALTIPEGESHWHNGATHVATDIIEVEDEKNAAGLTSLIERGLASEIEESSKQSKNQKKAASDKNKRDDSNAGKLDADIPIQELP
jgi:hypothetical protein